MGSKKKFRFSYKAKLFLPAAILIWFTVGVMAYYSFEREKQYRYGNVMSDIELINSRIFDMLQNDYDLNRFMSFVENYYGRGELEGIRVSVFKDNNEYPTHWVGEPIYDNFADMHINDRKSLYAYAEASDSTLNATVRTALPYNVSVSRWLNFDSGFWIFIFIMSAAVTFLTYVTASHTARNVTLLRDFTDRASTDKDFNAGEEFADDELGDISRRIIEIYNQRKAALRAHDREHMIALKASEERMRLRKQITDNVNHELKTPVGIIKGYIDTILSNPGIDEASKLRFLTKTQKQVNRLVFMLDDLSVLARLDSGGNIPAKEVDMNELLVTLDEEIYESGIGGDLTFVYELPENCKVSGSESLLNAAILNMVKNAAAYSQGSEMGLLCTGQNENFYSFAFYDNGTGVAEEHLPNLFDRFYRVESGRSRKKGGTGLGLSIVRSTILSMGGSISVRNRDTGGLEFLFTLKKWNQPS